MTLQSLKRRIADCDWQTIDAELDEYGVGRPGPLLDRDECNDLASSYDQTGLFRSEIVLTVPLRAR